MTSTPTLGGVDAANPFGTARPAGRVALGVLGAAAIVDWVALAVGASAVANVAQWLLMPALAVVVVASTVAPRPRAVRGLLVALAFSWLGDTLPDVVGEDSAFLAMVGCFLAAQVAYIATFWPWRRGSALARPLSALPYVAVYAILLALCAPGAGPMLGPIVGYGASLVLMAALATGVHRIAGIGGALFLVSDSLIALGEFADLDLPAAGLWVMVTYVVGQVLIAAGVLRRGAAPA